MYISWKMASKEGKADTKSGVTSYDEGTDIAIHTIQTIYSVIKISMKYFYKKCGTERPDIITPGLSIYCKGLKHKGRKLVQDTDLNFYKENQQKYF